MTEKEINQKIRELQERAYSVWTDAQKLVRENGQDDKIFLTHPIKAHCLNTTDNLRLIGEQLIDLCKRGEQK